MTRTALFTAAIAFTAAGCGSASSDEGNLPPPFGSDGVTFGSPQQAGSQQGGGVQQGDGSQPAGSDQQAGGTGAGSPGGQNVNEGNQAQDLVGAPAAPVGSGAAPATGQPPVMDPAMQPAPVGDATMVDVTIEAETLNQAISSNFVLEGGATNVGGIEVGSVICFDNVDLTGVQSIDVSYARNAPDVSSSARFAFLWGSPDVTQAENLGEKVTTDSGGWDVYATLNVGLSRAVNEVGLLCLRGMQGNGIGVIDNLTLRAIPAENDGVTDFNVAPPTGPDVAPVRVVGNQVQFGGPGTSVAGNSFFWSNGRFGHDLFYTAEAVSWLAQDWGAKIVRAAMAVDNGDGQLDQLGGYLTQPFDNQLNVQKVVNAAIENGIHVIIDYHAHAAEQDTQAAIEFFSEMASIYGEYNNVIYEIYNEPVNTGWPQIKAYAEQVIPAIRAQDPDNLIIVGTPFYSQDVDVASNDQLNDNNVAYTLHFYSATHGQGLRDKAITAMNNGAALFVTEWGSTGADGFGQPNAGATQQWMDFLQQNNISHCNWAIADQSQVGASGLVRGASPLGGWSDADLTASGRLARDIIRNW